MTKSGGCDFNREVVEQITSHRVARPREAMAEPAAQHLLGQTMPTDAAILAGELLKLDERLTAAEVDPCLCRRGGQGREDCPWKCRPDARWPDVA